MSFFDDFKKILVDFEATIMAEVKEEIATKMAAVEEKPVSEYILPYMNMQNVDGVLKDMDNKDVMVNNITDELRAELVGVSGMYPKVFSKGVSAHGYPGDGQTSAAVISIATESIKSVTGLSGNRLYSGCITSGNFNAGYSFGGKKTGATKFDLSSETSIEITFGVSLPGGGSYRSIGLWTRNSNGLAFQDGNLHKLNTINETGISGFPGLSTIGGNISCGGMSDYWKEISYFGNSPEGGTFRRITMKTETVRNIASNGGMQSHDQGGTSYTNKVIVEVGANDNRARSFFYFSTENFVGTHASNNTTGETQYAPGNGTNYSLGGYDSGNGGQHNRSEKTNQDTGICINLGTTAYKMSSASHYIG